MVNVSGVFQCIVLLLSCVSSCFSAPRHPRVAEVLVKHDALICESVSLVRGRDVYGLLDVFIPPFLPKAAYVPSKARENTIVDASLSMVDAVSAAIRLDWKSSERSVDPVLQNVIRVVCDAGVDVVAFRKGARSFLRSLKANLVPLRVDLQELVPEFLKPIVGHVDFALIEVLIRAAKWVQESYVDSVIFGYKPVGDVPFVGCHRPVVDKPRKAFSRQDNAKSFDDAVRILERRSRREAHSAQALADQSEIWRITVEECEKGYCEGPFTRADIERRFADTPHGPRCIPAFGIWQKGKLRRIDDAAISGHNDLTFMCETIVCDTADLPSMIAREFCKYVDFGAA